jgi:hypothetical protein
MSYPALHEIVIGGKKYIDLATLEKAIQSVYPLKSHSLRRLARYGRIPHKRIGMSRKDWFNLTDVKQALNLVLETDETEIDVDDNAAQELAQSFDEFLKETAKFSTEELLDSVDWEKVDKRKKELEADEDYLADL